MNMAARLALDTGAFSERPTWSRNCVEERAAAGLSPFWLVSDKYDRDGARLADGHYSRRTPGSPQFMPPGETLVLVTPCRTAVYGWWRPHPDAIARGAIAGSMDGLNGFTCSIFRNTGGILTSDLELAAELELARAAREGRLAGPVGPDGMLTYVWPRKIESTNPGWCFQIAGWTRDRWTKACPARRKRLLRKPLWLAGIAACEWVPRPDSVVAFREHATRSGA